jgi:hypothetical protein
MPPRRTLHDLRSPNLRSMTTVETKAAELWSAAADAAVKGGNQPPTTDWHGLSDDLKQYYLSLAGGIVKARRFGR